MSKNFVIEFEDIAKVYEDRLRRSRVVHALRGVSFCVEAGETFGLVGPNRAGKSTLIKILLGLCRPTGGKVWRFGRPLADRSTLARIGYMHENEAFPRYLTAAALLDYYGTLSGVPGDVLAWRVPHLLEKVGLGDRSREPIARFSKGMAQRLALAQALINDPELLVLDEPTEGLDLIGRRLIYDVVSDLQERGRTVLLVSHHLADVEDLCSRLAVIVEGRLAHLGTTESLTHTHSSPDRSLEQALQTLYEKSPT